MSDHPDLSVLPFVIARRRARRNAEAVESLLRFALSRVEVVRVDGGAQCPNCSREYRDHPPMPVDGYESFRVACGEEVMLKL